MDQTGVNMWVTKAQKVLWQNLKLQEEAALLALLQMHCWAWVWLPSWYNHLSRDARLYVARYRLGAPSQARGEPRESRGCPK